MSRLYDLHTGREIGILSRNYIQNMDQSPKGGVDGGSNLDLLSRANHKMEAVRKETEDLAESLKSHVGRDAAGSLLDMHEVVNTLTSYDLFDEATPSARERFVATVYSALKGLSDGITMGDHQHLSGLNSVVTKPGSLAQAMKNNLNSKLQPRGAQLASGGVKFKKMRPDTTAAVAQSYTATAGNVERFVTEGTTDEKAIAKIFSAHEWIDSIGSMVLGNSVFTTPESKTGFLKELASALYFLAQGISNADAASKRESVWLVVHDAGFLKDVLRTSLQEVAGRIGSDKGIGLDSQALSLARSGIGNVLGKIK